MNLADYIAMRQRPVLYPKADIIERWNGRVLYNDWHVQGRDGAEKYLKRFGRQIGSDKCIRLAVYADGQGYPEFAQCFWEKAYSIDYPGNGTGTSFVPVLTPEEIFPPHMQPGILATSKSYVIFAMSNKVWFQSSDLEITPAPNADAVLALQEVTLSIGAFIAEAEVRDEKVILTGCLWHEGFGELYQKEMQVEGVGLILDFLSKTQQRMVFHGQ